MLYWFRCLRRVTYVSLCDNWRGISLLDVVGKVFAKVIQRCLQTVVEKVVADSQCDFWCNRGCIGMIFVHAS